MILSEIIFYFFGFEKFVIAYRPQLSYQFSSRKGVSMEMLINEDDDEWCWVLTNHSKILESANNFTFQANYDSVQFLHHFNFYENIYLAVFICCHRSSIISATWIRLESRRYRIIKEEKTRIKCKSFRFRVCKENFSFLKYDRGYNENLRVVVVLFWWAKFVSLNFWI